eukprot:m51a1_g11961 hypothetical protein (367) ;mRNA; f:796648-798256
MAQIRAESGTVWPSKRADKKLSTKGWKMHKGSGRRNFVQHVNFARPFTEAPNVFLAFSALDLLSDDNHRCWVSPTNVTERGFDISFGTDQGSHVWSASASFFAYEKAPAAHDGSHIESGNYMVNRHTPGYGLSFGAGERNVTARILFRKPFANGVAPRVAVCLAGVDAAPTADHRVAVLARDVTHEAFVLVVRTWSNSAVNSVSVAWLAVEDGLESAENACLKIGTQQFSSAEDGFVLDKGHGDRDQKKHVRFDRAFDRRPSGALVCASAIDVEVVKDDKDLRVKMIETGINQDGFDLTLGTWNDTCVWGATATWIAFTDGDINTVCVPCGHLCCCLECSKLLKPPNAKCPICRTKVDKVIKVFMS